MPRACTMSLPGSNCDGHDVGESGARSLEISDMALEKGRGQAADDCHRLASWSTTRRRRAVPYTTIVFRCLPASRQRFLRVTWRIRKRPPAGPAPTMIGRPLVMIGPPERITKRQPREAPTRLPWQRGLKSLLLLILLTQWTLGLSARLP